MLAYCSDFETVNNPEDCRVWAWGVLPLFGDDYATGETIEEFFEYISKLPGKTMEIFFHNLTFDGEFLLDYLLRNGYEYDYSENKGVRPKHIKTIISDNGIKYKIDVNIGKSTRSSKTITFRCSLRMLNASIKNLAKSFKIPEQKLDIDYNKYRPKGYKMTEEEELYLIHDIIIMQKALQHLYARDMKKLTVGANALNYYKKLIGDKRFSTWFPNDYNDFDLRKAYRGGWCYANPAYKGKALGNGIVFDVNSLYPYIMHERELPWGEPKYFAGKYVENDEYPLYIQSFSCNCKTKKGHYPSVQLKQNRAKIEYLEQSLDEDDPVLLHLTNVDLKLFFEQYDVWNVEYYNGYCFRSSSDMFREYVDIFTAEKIAGKKDKDGAAVAIAKLMLNSLYGKFGTNPKSAEKIPYFCEEENRVKYRDEMSEQPPKYLPVAIFVTSWARDLIIRAAQATGNRFVYADTDSLHLIGFETPEINVDEYELGAFKLEYKFLWCKVLAQKTYLEYIHDFKDGECVTKKVACASMPESCHKFVNKSNWGLGNEIGERNKSKKVSGGTIIYSEKFVLRERI